MITVYIMADCDASWFTATPSLLPSLISKFSFCVYINSCNCCFNDKRRVRFITTVIGRKTPPQITTT